MLIFIYYYLNWKVRIKQNKKNEGKVEYFLLFSMKIETSSEK